MGKNVWKSKTVWVNLVALAAMLVQFKTGAIMDMETQAMLLGVINLVLRLVTGEPIDWGKAAVVLLLPLAMLLGQAAPALAGSATFSWAPNSETDLAGYKIHYGSAPRSYDQVVDCGNVTVFTMENTVAGVGPN